MSEKFLCYRVKPMREAGLEVKWSKLHNGRPCILARNPKADLKHQKEKWWIVDAAMFELMKEYGIVEGFNMSTVLGDLLAI